MATSISADELIGRYDVFFLDAYGVLLHAGGALPHAAAFLDALRKAGKTFLILSNDASKSIETSFHRYTGFGLGLAREQIVTSGVLLADHFIQQDLVGARCLVLGTDDSREYVRDAGGVVAPCDDDDASVLVIGDDEGFPFLEATGQVITVLLRRMERGLPLHLVLPNPDLIFPVAEGSFGITAGAIATMIEAILQLRFPDGRARFHALGKPHAPIFEAGWRRAGQPDRARVVMVGDQIVTDIAGANRFGIDSALALTGISRVTDLARFEARPTWVLSDLRTFS